MKTTFATALAFVAAAIAICAIWPQAALADVSLVKSGQPNAVIVLPERPTREEARAAKEIQYYVEKISKVTLPVIGAKDEAGGKVTIYVGRTAPEELLTAIRRHSSDPSAFALFVGGNSVALTGVTHGTQDFLEEDFAVYSKALDQYLYEASRIPRNEEFPSGTRIAALELLEQLGVRWYFPGVLGTVIPQASTITLKAQQTVDAPAFPARHMSGVKHAFWQERMRHGGPRFPSAHGVPGFSKEESKALFKEHPEYFALVDGKRTDRQLNISHPEVISRAIEHTKKYFRENPDEEMIGMGPNDGRGFCEDAACQALDGGDYDPFGNSESMTDRYVWFFNQVLKGIEDEFPNKRIAFYAYSVYNRPPVKWKPDKKLVPAVALITLCRIHGVGNPVCPEKSYQKEIVEGWGRLVPEVYDRGYWFNLADPGLPFFMIERVAREIRLGKKLGIAGWRVESAYNWSGAAPSLYVASKLMWDDSEDVAALMSDFYSRFFGPAAKQMRTYIEAMDAATTHADYHTGSAWDAPHIYNDDVREVARKALQEAGQLSPSNSIYAQRIDAYNKHFEYLEAFIAMMTCRAAHDHDGAMKALQRAESLREDLTTRDTPLMSVLAEPYLRRFYAPAVGQAYERTTNGNKLVAGLANSWQFQVDPQETGVRRKLWHPDTDANQWGNSELFNYVPPVREKETKMAVNMNVPQVSSGTWQLVKPYTMSWSNIGLRYFKDHAWYRQRVEIPAEFKDQRIFLWFGGVDEAVRVWVNGHHIGKGAGSFRPFELDATEAVRPGENNIVVVEAINEHLNELGTGGIVAPVMFYSPKDGKDAKPQGGIAPQHDDIEIVAE